MLTTAKLCNSKQSSRISTSNRRSSVGHLTMQFDTINQKGNSASILTVDFLSVAFGECITQESLVIRQDLRIPAVAKALEECSGPLDVGEKEGDRSSRKASHDSLRQPV